MAAFMRACDISNLSQN